MAKVHLRVQHSHPYQQPTAHSTHGNHHFYGASQHTNQQPSMNGTNSYHQQLGSIPNPQQKQNLSTPMTTTVHPFYVQSQQQQQQVQQPQQQQQFQQPQQSQHSQYHLQNGSTTSTQPPQSTNGENMYYSNNNNGNSENTTMHKVVKPIARRSVPGDEPIRSPDYNYYRSVVSNRTPYRSHGFLLHVSSKLGEVQRTTVTCPFMNKTAIVLANKRRKTTQRPTFALSVHLLKTYKNINTLYYAEKRKRDAIQKQNAIRSNQQKILPKAIATQPSQQLYPTSAFVQQQQQQQQQLQMQYYPQVQPLVYQTQYPYPPQMQPQLLPQNYLQQQAINSSLFHYNQPPTSIIPNPPLYNDGYDDENGNYVVQINEELANRYIVQENLGKGSFGVVVKAYDTYKGELVAVKVIKNKSQFYEQAKVEIAILSDLQQKDKNKEFNVVQMKHFFEWRSHLCIVFELLSYNLYDLLKYTNFKGVSLKLIRKFAQQLLYTLYFLSRSDVNIIHCDLKPENILLKHHRKSLIKVIDFGSSCYINKKMFKYIQSRFYRSPEVLLGLPYSTTIDMWSFGCILVEMHTGLPLFDGKNERDQLWKIIQVLGMPPRWMIEKSPKKDMFFKFNQATQSYVLNNPNYVPNSRSLHDIIGVNTHGPEGRRANQEGHTRTDYLQFYDLVTHILQFDPNARALPIDALKHPFFPIHSHASPSSDGPRMSTSPESPIGQYYPTPRPIQQHHHQQHQQQQVLPQEQQVYQTAPHLIQHMDVNHINHAHYPQNPYYQIPPYYYHPTNPRTQIG